MLRSQDGGKTWKKLTSTPGTRPYLAVETDPSTAGVVWVVDLKGIPFRNLASGTGTWQRIDAGLPHGLEGLVVDPVTGDTYGWTGVDTVFRLPGNSSTWQEVTGNLSVSLDAVLAGPHGAVALTFEGARLLTSVSPPTWSDFSAGLPSNDSLFEGAADGAGTLYVVDGSDQAWKIGPSDASWSPADQGVPSGVSSDVWADVFHAGHVLLGTAAGPNVGQGPLWRSLDGGSTWSRAANGIQAVFVNSSAVDPRDAGTVLAATGSDGVERSADGGKTWKKSKGIRDEPVEVALDPVHPLIALVTINGGGLMRSTDGGATWKTVAGQAPSLVAFDHHGVAWELGNGLFRSADGGLTWTKYAGLTGISTEAFTLLPDESTAGAMFAGTGDGVFRLPHKGDTWGRVGLAGDRVRSLAVDGGHPSTLYAGTETTGVWRSRDDGVTWHQVLNQTSTERVATAPGHAGVVYVAARAGVLRSTDVGARWKTLGHLGEDPSALAGAADGRTVFAGTRGAGVEAWTS